MRTSRRRKTIVCIRQSRIRSKNQEVELISAALQTVAEGAAPWLTQGISCVEYKISLIARFHFGNYIIFHAEHRLSVLG
jgi:hypothetical protein